MHLYEIVENLKILFPEKNAYKDDRVGLQVNLGNEEINNIHIAYELNDEIINEAIFNNSNLIILFHPLIFNRLEQINVEERVGNLLVKLISNRINLYVVHTIFDTYKEGSNNIILNKFKLNKFGNIYNIDNVNDIGLGVIGEFNEKIHFKDFLNKCKEIFGGVIRYSKGKNEYLKKIAIIGGSGSSFLNEVLSMDVDAFLTADNTYHNFHKTKNKIWLVDIGHWEMEQFVAEGIFNYLKSNELFKNINLSFSKLNTNPINYY